jgi:hypothetical protein
MKKQVKKMALSRETLLTLVENDLPKVNGGSSNPGSHCLACDTWQFTCVTNSLYC